MRRCEKVFIRKVEERECSSEKQGARGSEWNSEGKEKRKKEGWRQIQEKSDVINGVDQIKALFFTSWKLGSQVDDRCIANV